MWDKIQEIEERVVDSFVGHGTTLRFIFKKSLKLFRKTNMAKIQNIIDVCFMG